MNSETQKFTEALNFIGSLRTPHLVDVRRQFRDSVDFDQAVLAAVRCCQNFLKSASKTQGVDLTSVLAGLQAIEGAVGQNDDLVTAAADVSLRVLAEQ